MANNLTPQERHVRYATYSAAGLVAVIGLLMMLVWAFISFNNTNERICEANNRTVDYVDALVAKTNMNADRPPVTVADPAVQKLIDEGRKQSAEFRRFAKEQSKLARCHT